MKGTCNMRSSSNFVVLWAVVLGAMVATSTAHAKKGLYLGLGFGGAVVDGDTAIPLQNPALDPDYGNGLSFNGARVDLNELVRTKVGGGFAADIRLGYNILGMVAIEVDIAASGNNLGDGNQIEGQFGVFGLLKLFPAQFFDEVRDRWWDPYVFVGGGVYALLYNPDAHKPIPMQNDGRAWWPAGALKYGFGCDFYLKPFVSLGIDLAFTHGFLDEFVIDRDDSITTTPIGDAQNFVFTPTAKITFHFFTE